MLSQEQKDKLRNLDADMMLNYSSSFAGFVPRIGICPIPASLSQKLPVSILNMAVSTNYPIDVVLPVTPVIIKTQPVATINGEEGIAINLSATAEGAVSYQWFKGATKIADGVGNSAVFNKAVSVVADTGVYKVVFTGDEGVTVTSSNCTVTITAKAPA